MAAKQQQAARNNMWSHILHMLAASYMPDKLWLDKITHKKYVGKPSLKGISKE